MKKAKRLVIPSDLERLVEVDSYVESLMAKLPFDKDARDDIAISLSEAVTNAIEHGNGGDISKSVHIEFEISDEGLGMVITDEGAGFNSSNVPDPRENENLLNLSGRGLLIIEHLMDLIEVSATPKGTRIKMLKNFPKQN